MILQELLVRLSQFLVGHTVLSCHTETLHHYCYFIKIYWKQKQQCSVVALFVRRVSAFKNNWACSRDQLQIHSLLNLLVISQLLWVFFFSVAC